MPDSIPISGCQSSSSAAAVNDMVRAFIAYRSGSLPWPIVVPGIRLATISAISAWWMADAAAPSGALRFYGSRRNLGSLLFSQLSRPSVSLLFFINQLSCPSLSLLLRTILACTSAFVDAIAAIVGRPGQEAVVDAMPACTASWLEERLKQQKRRLKQQAETAGVGC